MLFLVDDGNAMCWPTGYAEWGGDKGLRERPILPIELRLAMAIRSLLDDTADAREPVLHSNLQHMAISARQHSALQRIDWPPG